MIQTKEIRSAIDAFSLENTEICIHSSMKSFGDEIEGGINGLVDTFLSKNCTIMTPTFSYEYMQNPTEKYMPKRNGINYSNAFNPLCDRSKIFHPDSKSISVDVMGLFPMCVLDNPNSIRGNHPINSFTAIGKYAQRLTMTQTPQAVYAPFQQLIDDDGYILLMGVGLDRATIIHYAEQLAGRTLFIRWANDQDGNVIPIPGGGCSSGFINFEPLLKKRKQVRVGNSLWQCYKAADMVDICKKAIIEKPQITHCSNPECLSCNDAVLGGAMIDFDYR